MSVLDLFMAGTSVGQAYWQYEAGKQESYEIERQAEQEQLAAEGRELQRRRQLNKALSANVVSQASSGISGEGTPASIAMESARNISMSESMETLSDRLKIAQMKRQAKNVKSAAKLQAAGTLLDDAKSAAKAGG